MTKNMITIIIPCYNVSKFLEDCFESLNYQTYKNFEVIFVNDGSSDDTLQKIENFCSKKNNCFVINQTNQGVSMARNNAIKKANGEFIYFYDADDLLSPNALEILCNGIQNSDMSICSYKVVKENFNYTKTKKQKMKKSKLFSGTENILSQFMSTRLFKVNIWNKLFRKSIIEKMDSYPNVFNPEIYYGEDLDCAFRYLTHCSSASYIPCKLYYYRSRKGSEVHSKFNAKKMLSIFSAHDRNIELCSKKFPSVEKYVRAFKCVSCVEMLFRIYPSNFDNVEVIKKLFNELKSNMKSLKQSKKVQRYKRWTIPFVPPLLKLILRKKIKKQKQ